MMTDVASPTPGAKVVRSDNRICRFITLGAFAAQIACRAETIDAVTAGAAQVTPMHDAGGRDQGPLPAATGYHTDHTRIVDGNGNTFRIKAVTWYGLDQDFSPHGLCCLKLDDILTEVQTLGFNTLRIAWSSQMLDATSKPMSINDSLNTDLLTLDTPLKLLDEVVRRANLRGLKVILARFRSRAGNQDDLWYDSDYDQARFVSDWSFMAQHYAGNPAVIGCDLQSDLRGQATWGDGNTLTDWRAAAETAGNAILRMNDRVLVFVQGVEKSLDGSLYWRGGNLKDAAARPVKLAVPNRLVYAPQDFPKTANNSPNGMIPSWFSTSDYPSNLSANVWDPYWGYLLADQPVMLSAFGTAYADPSDQKWLGALEQYIVAHPGLSFAYFALNPEAPDLKGIYDDPNWARLNAPLVTALGPILTP